VIYFDEEEELISENYHLSKCLFDNFFYIPPHHQNPYFYINNKDDVWFYFIILKPFYFFNYFGILFVLTYFKLNKF
jgi:hypothetical protein